MNENNTASGCLPALGNAGPVAISFSSEQVLDRYRSHVDHFDLSEKAKAELLMALWHMMGSFVDRAFGDDPVQLSQKDGGNFASIRESQDSAVLDSGGDAERCAKSELSGTFSRKARRQSVKGKR